ncbi:glycosyl hydrolase [Streptomyces sp. NPDC004610]|uniref:glycosyl hydrolase n=1 Tax=unclassified Streptomyces TaxID=2593676 RepID=UPI0033A2083D
MRQLRRRTQLLLALLLVIAGVAGTTAVIQWQRSDGTSLNSANAAGTGGADRTVTFQNRTDEPLWVGATVNADGSAVLTGLPKLDPGQSATITVPEHAGAGHWRGKFFARQGCGGEDGSTFKCVVGDCGPYADRCSTGEQPTSLAEFNFDPKDALAPWYNVSYVNAVSVPITITPDGVQVPESGACQTMGCAKDLISACPAENLTKDPATGKALVCVNPNRDAKTPYSDAISGQCPTAYAWSKQDTEPGNQTVRQCAECTGMTVTFGTGAAASGGSAPTEPREAVERAPEQPKAPDREGAGAKGVSINPEPGISEAIVDSGAAWYYNWASSTGPVARPEGVEFVPMIWGAGSVTDAELNAARQEGTTLLGFNEPDHGGQANMTPEQALDLWPRLQSTGLRLGAPAVAANADVAGGWLDRFMTGAQQRGLKVDFIPVHWYGSDFGPDAVNHLRDYLQRVHDRYQKPIWLTEYGLIDWSSGTARLPGAPEQAAFVTSSTQMLEGLGFLERYAWFTLSTDTFGTGLYTGAVPNASGEAYRALG